MAWHQVKPLYEKTAGIIALVTIALGGALKLFSAPPQRPITDYAKHMFIKTFSFLAGTPQVR